MDSSPTLYVLGKVSMGFPRYCLLPVQCLHQRLSKIQGHHRPNLSGRGALHQGWRILKCPRLSHRVLIHTSTIHLDIIAPALHRDSMNTILVGVGHPSDEASPNRIDSTRSVRMKGTINSNPRPPSTKTPSPPRSMRDPATEVAQRMST